MILKSQSLILDMPLFLLQNHHCKESYKAYENCETETSNCDGFCSSNSQQLVSFTCPDFFDAYITCKNTSENNSSACNSQDVMSLWHSRLSHPNKLILNQVLSHLHVKIPPDTVVEFCEACQHGELQRISIPSSTFPHTKGHLQLIHMDVSGPTPISSIEGYRYY